MTKREGGERFHTLLYSPKMATRGPGQVHIHYQSPSTQGSSEAEVTTTAICSKENANPGNRTQCRGTLLWPGVSASPQVLGPQPLRLCLLFTPLLGSSAQAQFGCTQWFENMVALWSSQGIPAMRQESPKEPHNCGPLPRGLQAWERGDAE